MLIPSIDLMAGRIVQLVQGEKKALEFDEFDPWLTRFSKYPLVQLIDLDAAKGDGNNAKLVEQFCHRLPCQVGGGEERGHLRGGREQAGVEDVHQLVAARSDEVEARFERFQIEVHGISLSR